ncbi:hypothetical protein Acj133p113 [Acinetobacter phage 133]|uniref:Uncharacterized protein n=1 Tax=Acinetobacter phage 133 TaxID=2919552 RepID=D9I647_9CAUD|nr:hypothetical protein Acj133p113 [Acinetobacter phage 133]ADJ19428.1 hypothetical protein Acj133p113 [Acinetobacter phage 133]
MSSKFKHFKSGQYIWLWSMMTFVKIVSVRHQGSKMVLWVRHKDNDFPMSTIDGEMYTVNNGNKHSSRIMRATTIVDVVAILVIATCLYVWKTL